MLGPIDYVVVGFKGNNFDGTILGELSKAVDSGVIRLVDLVFIIKDEKGDVTMAEVADQYDELKDVAKLLGHEDDLPLLTEDDVQKLGAKMESDTSAGVLVIEHLWAKGLKKALLDKGAVLLAEGRLHPDKVGAAVEDIKSTK
jgi:hypothetical protein